MTTEQIRNQSKTVTRRFAWWNLKAGDVVRAVEKSMGMRRGEKMKPLAMLRIVSVRKEQFNAITQEDVLKEGFPDWTPQQFVKMLVEHYKADPKAEVNRIEFEYLQHD